MLDTEFWISMAAIWLIFYLCFAWIRLDLTFLTVARACLFEWFSVLLNERHCVEPVCVCIAVFR